MRKFKDSEGREWALSLNIGEAKRVKDALALDLLDPTSLQQLAGDPYLICNVLFVLCEKQAKDAGIDDAAFGRGLAGDSIDEATDAFLAELVDFFPKRQREALRNLLAQIQNTQNELAAMAADKASSPAMTEAIQRTKQQASDEIDRLLDAAGRSSGSTPASLV